MIISVSRRTDIPAFYGEWFMRRIEAGFAMVENPFNPTQSRRVDLRPEAVDCMVFWTRNPRPMFKHLDALQKLGYKFYFLFTITGYPRELEPNLPSGDVAVAAFRELSDRIGIDKVIWRYDPIVLSSLTDADFHRMNYDRLSKSLEGATGRVIMSLLDFYRKTNRHLKELSSRILIAWHDPAIGDIESIRFLGELKEIANSRGMTMQSCAEERDLAPLGILPGRCVDSELIETVFGVETGYMKDPSQRPGCLCCTSIDIGAYNTCGYGCVYCYANASFEKSVDYLRLHDRDSLSLGRFSAKEPA